LFIFAIHIWLSYLVGGLGGERRSANDCLTGLRSSNEPLELVPIHLCSLKLSVLSFAYGISSFCFPFGELPQPMDRGVGGVAEIDRAGGALWWHCQR
jgi:hypothetical protein